MVHAVGKQRELGSSSVLGKRLSSSLQTLNTSCFIPREIKAHCTRQCSWLEEEGGCLSYVLQNAPYLLFNGPQSMSHKSDKVFYWVFLQTSSCRELRSVVGAVIFVGGYSERQRGFAWQNADGTPKPHRTGVPRDKPSSWDSQAIS